MYQFESRVRYSEIGEDKKLSLQSLLDYLQDCATFHSEDIGRSMTVQEARHCAWVLTSWQVEVQRYPDFGEKIRTATWAYGFRGFIGERNFTITDENGAIAVAANSQWAYISTENGLPVRLTAEETDAYGVEPKLDMNYAPRKIAVPKECETREAFPVMKHHIDTNHHVNNAQYIRMAQDYLPDGFKVKHMRAEYKKQAFLDDIITPLIAREDDRFVVSLTDTDNAPFAVVEFREEEKA